MIEQVGNNLKFTRSLYSKTGKRGLIKKKYRTLEKKYEMFIKV